MAGDDKDGLKSASTILDVPSPLLPLIAGMKRVFASTEHADLTITCKGREWEVHKVLLCAQSEWFQKACAGPFKEAEEKKIKLDDDDPEVVNAMLHYLYNFDYGGDYDNSPDRIAPIMLDIRVFAIADKYLITPLKELAVEVFTERAAAGWGTDEFAAAISEIYSIIPEHEDHMRRIVVRAVQEHATELFSEGPSYASFNSVMRQIADFGADVSQALARRSTMVTWYCCPTCSSTFAMGDYEGVGFDCPMRCCSFRTVFWWTDHVVEK
ncbi:hypothetical protein LTR36_004009 [Oleoguttula mirabilis]|uniref:BTB domain-containing protein n=1 Tax=Oleoguttula mirabilis TaxID=1507867 RepID=A0AAV9JIH7_9PEZI|nr:hypothetical protein LTR36_004009 [Oleoguttula mirabilis]